MGLSEYESRIYSSLLLNGPLTAGKIAVYSGVPRVKVYSSLKRLVDAGLVYEEPGRPARYGARDGAPTLGLIAERLESEARLLKKLSLIVRRIEKRRARGDVWVFEDPGSFASKIRELLFKARRRVNVIAGAEGLAFLYRKLGRTLDFIAGKGVSVEIYGWSNRVGAKALKELSYSYPVEIVEYTASRQPERRKRVRRARHPA